jgi:hypothetical protein
MRGSPTRIAWPIASAIGASVVVGVIEITALYLRPSLLLGIWAALASMLVLVAAIGALIVTRRTERSSRRPRLALIALLAASLTVILGSAIIVHAGRWWGCTQYANSLCVSLEMYLADFGAYPRAATWCDDMKGYYGDPDNLRCLERYGIRCGYALNKSISGLRPSDISTDPEKTVVFFDSDVGWNAAGGPELLPRKPRHFGRDMYAFAGVGLSRTLSRHALSNGTAGIFWNPRAAKRKNGRGK